MLGAPLDAVGAPQGLGVGEVGVGVGAPPVLGAPGGPPWVLSWVKGVIWGPPWYLFVQPIELLLVLLLMP